MDIAALLAVFLARLAGGYAICVGLIGPTVTEGSWRKVSCFVITAVCVAGIAAGHDWKAYAATAAAALLCERAIAFGVGWAPVFMIPFGVWLLWPLDSVGQVPSAIAIGGTLGAMLLGHSYLTARGLSFVPLKRMAYLLFGILIVRAAFVVPVFFDDSLVMGDWIYLSARVAFGLLLPLVFSWMVIQCVKIESNQSATGILYAMTLFVFLGELTAVYLNVERHIAA